MSWRQNRETAEARAPGPEFLGTAAEHVVTAVPVFGPEMTAEAARTAMSGGDYGSAVDIAVCETGPAGIRRLRGLLRIERLLAAPGEVHLDEIADLRPPVVAPGVDQEVAAWRAVQHGESSLAVVDADDRFIGLVPPQAMLRILLTEHDEDMARLGGYLKSSATARQAAREPVGRRFRHRMPWLLLGLLGMALSAGVIGSFEERLSRNVTLAFFLPGIVYMADAVGTQTETLVIRGLSVGVGIRQLVRREIITGVLVAAALAAIFGPFTLLYGDPQVMLVASLSLLAACAIASIVAMALPWLLYRLGRDPAFGSGPVATVIQDLLSITLYLLIAVAIMD